LSISGRSAEVSYVPFPGSVGYKVAALWKSLFRYDEIDFYRYVFDCLFDTLMQNTGLESIEHLRTRRFRNSVEFAENLAFEYSRLKNKISISEQERAVLDFAIEWSFSSYHEYRYWDRESRKIHQELCRGNEVLKSSFRIQASTIEQPVRSVGRGSKVPSILAFPAQVETDGFSNAAHSDVHLAAEFSRCLGSLRDAGFAITVKLKDPSDSSYYSEFPCISPGRGNYMDLTPAYDYFLSCGYATPGIDLKVKGFRSFYFYPETSGNRLYPDITITSAQQFISLVGAG
jgi:hypothetical protein